MNTFIEIIKGDQLLGGRKIDFRNELKRVFDASIPWDDAEYDDSFQDHYIEHCDTAIMVRNEMREPIALSVAFFLKSEDFDIFYIAGIWVDRRHQSIGLGRTIIDLVIEHGINGTSANRRERKLYISLRTHNAKVYEYFGRRFQVFPSPYVQAPDAIVDVAAVIHDRFSKNRIFERSDLVVRSAYPRGIIVGKYHRVSDSPFQSLIDRKLDVDAGDCLILVMESSSLAMGPKQHVGDLLSNA